MERDIMDCNTIKECLLWADQQWPGFWKFATHQPMTKKEKTSLSIYMKQTDPDPLFEKMMRQLLFVSKLDQSKEAKKLLILGATAMMAFGEQKSDDHIQKYTK
ncbi:MAG: hypothetical protein CL916_06850 [Deltaproteobacteria bacterium]|nr:hypothetical protein [Deltaproteobacteria bacterium]